MVAANAAISRVLEAWIDRVLVVIASSPLGAPLVLGMSLTQEVPDAPFADNAWPYMKPNV